MGEQEKDGGTQQEPKGSKPFFSNAAAAALEKVLVWIMYTAIVGSAVYGYTRLQSIELNIAKHHGAGWEELKDIVQTSQIQSEVRNSQTTLKGELLKQKNIIDSKIDENKEEIRKLNERLERMTTWIAQGDKLMAKRQKEQFKGHAVYDDDGEETRNCKVNYAHANGKSFNVNDRLKVNREESSKNETTTCLVVSTIYDIKSPSVLLAVNKKMAKGLGFTKEKGIVTVSTNLAELPEDRRWKSLDEIQIAE